MIIVYARNSFLPIQLGSTPQLISSSCRQCPTSNTSIYSETKLHNLEKENTFCWEHIWHKIANLQRNYPIYNRQAVKKVAIHSVEAQHLQWPETQNNTFRPSGKKYLQKCRLKEHRLCFSNSLYMQNITKKLVLNLVDILLLLKVCTPL
jgi:hypothetical protein